MYDGIIETTRYLWAPLMAIFGWALWSIKQATISRAEVHQMIKHDHSQDERIATIEGKIVSHHDLALLWTEINALKLKTAANGTRQDTELKSIKASVGRIEKYLLEAMQMQAR